MTSTLSRLFLFAKATEAEARENFTTEALAAAIRSEPEPFVALLREAGLAAEGATFLTAATQVTITGRRLDLVLTLGSSEWQSVIVFEVKVHAGESGGQLAAYTAYANGLPDCKVVVLGPDRLGELPWIAWQQVRTSVVDSGTKNPSWRDLKLYLEEIGMADAHSEPVTADELRAIGPASSLLGKVARILSPFVTKAKDIWRDGNWPASEPRIRDQLGKHLVNHGTLAINDGTTFRAGLGAGARHAAETNDATLGLWVWTRPNRPEHERILRQADAGGLGAAWSRDPNWELLAASRRLAEFSTPAEATQWLLERLRELDQAGILRLLPTLGPGEQDGEGGEEPPAAAPDTR